MGQLVEPEQGHPREQRALAGDRLAAHDHVEGRDAVGGHHQDAIGADGVVVAHLAAAEQRQRVQVDSLEGAGGVVMATGL